MRNRRPTQPGEILRDFFLESRRITVSAFAQAVGCSRQHMSDIVNSQARIEPRMAARIGKVLGTSAQLWLNLQSAVDAWDAEREIATWQPSRTYLPPEDASVTNGR